MSKDDLINNLLRDLQQSALERLNRALRGFERCMRNMERDSAQYAAVAFCLAADLDQCLAFQVWRKEQIADSTWFVRARIKMLLDYAEHRRAVEAAGYAH
jgi:hypothetical protein